MVRLPAEYQEVEYLESDGGKYLNLPYGFLDTDEIELVCENHSTGNDKYMISPSVWNNNNNRFALAGNYFGDFKVGFGSRSTLYGSFTPSMPLNALKHTWRYKNRLFTMLDDETQIAVSDVSSVNFGSETNYLRLFYGYDASTAGRIYSFKQIKQSGESLNLIPCYRKSDNEPGMYDTVTKQFFTNSGTGTFLVGNDVSWDTASLIERRRQILLNTPHLTTLSANPLTFQTDISANLKDCKIYFEPVQEGEGDPSPDNVRPITGWDGVTIYKTGKNLFANQNGARCYVGMKAGVTYAVSYNAPSNAYFRGYDVNGGYVTGIIWMNVGIVNGRHYGTITPSIDIPYGSIYVGSGVSEAQIEVGSAPTSYEPYTGTSLTLPFPQTIYGGYVDLVRGEVVETWACTYMDAYKWTYIASTKRFESQYLVRASRTAGLVTVLSDVYNGIENASGGSFNSDAPDKSMCFNTNGGKPYVILKDSDYTDAESFKASLSGHKLTYKLATPNTYQLDPETIKTLKGTNNIWSNANGNIEVKFWKH